MTKSNNRILAGSLLVLGLFACDGSKRDGPPSIEDIRARLVSVSVTTANPTIELAGSIELAATAVLDDGTNVDVTGDVVWSSANPELIAVGMIPGGPCIASALRVGKVAITATLGSVHGLLELTAADPTMIEFVLAPDVMTTINMGAEQQFTASGTFSNGWVVDVTERLEWVSSDPAVVSVSNEPGTKGLAIGRGAGVASITASFEDISHGADMTIECAYPGRGTRIVTESVMPNIYWTGAYGPQSQQREFGMEQVFCSNEFESVKTIIFYVGAGWCPACPDYIRALNSLSGELEQLGAMIVWVDAEDANYRPADSTYANQNINSYIGENGRGIRVGDADVQPEPGIFLRAPMIDAFPTALIVRKRDMTIITDQSRARGLLPFIAIARNPEGDWRDPDAPPFISNCEPDADEIYEPNDTAEQAIVLPMGSFEGGICTAEPDYYRIDHQGRWRVTVEFTHSVGDLDVYVWDSYSNRPIQNGETRVGSESLDDNESFEHEGAALIRVHGFQGSSAPYRLTLEAL